MMRIYLLGYDMKFDSLFIGKCFLVYNCGCGEEEGWRWGLVLFLSICSFYNIFDFSIYNIFGIEIYEWGRWYIYFGVFNDILVC